MTKIDQSIIRDALERFFKEKGYTPIYDRRGMCHGLRLVYAFYKAEDNTSQFFTLLNEIATWDSLNYDVETSIQKFFSIANWIQNSEKFIPTISQYHLDDSFKIIGADLETKYLLGGTLDRDIYQSLLFDCLRTQESILLSSADHGITCSYRDKPSPTYILYDPNFLYDPEKETGEQYFSDFNQFFEATELAFDFERQRLLHLKDQMDDLNLNINLKNEGELNENNKLASTDVTSQKYLARIIEIIAPPKINLDPSIKLKSMPDFVKPEEINIADIDGKTSLHMSSLVGDLEAVKFLIQSGADIDQVDKQGNTALSIACQKGHVGIVKYLIESGADLRKGSPFTFAIQQGHLKIVKKLHKAGIDLDEKLSSGMPALYFAAARGRNDILNYLITKSKTKNVNEVYKGFTPIFIAIKNGHLETVRILLKNGAAVDANQHNALIFSIQNNQNSIARELISQGANIETISRGLTPIWVALNENNFEMVEFLINHKANLSVLNAQGKTLLEMSSLKNPIIFQKILESSPNIKDEDLIKIYHLSNDQDITYKEKIALTKSIAILKSKNKNVALMTVADEVVNSIQTKIEGFSSQVSMFNFSQFSSNPETKILIPALHDVISHLKKILDTFKNNPQQDIFTLIEPLQNYLKDLIEKNPDVKGLKYFKDEIDKLSSVIEEKQKEMMGFNPVLKPTFKRD